MVEPEPQTCPRTSSPCNLHTCAVAETCAPGSIRAETPEETRQRADHYTHAYDRASAGVCPHSGLGLVECKEVDVCDCFEFEWARHSVMRQIGRKEGLLEAAAEVEREERWQFELDMRHRPTTVIARGGQGGAGSAGGDTTWAAGGAGIGGSAGARRQSQTEVVNKLHVILTDRAAGIDPTAYWPEPLMELLEHLWVCPFEAFACGNRIHANHEPIVRGYRNAKAASQATDTTPNTLED